MDQRSAGAENTQIFGNPTNPPGATSVEGTHAHWSGQSVVAADLPASAHTLSGADLVLDTQVLMRDGQTLEEIVSA
ncbi:MAG: hypothetical protein AAGF12_07095, partial [Myxococcota bacterium]